MQCRYVDVILNLIRLAGDYVSEEVMLFHSSVHDDQLLDLILLPCPTHSIISIYAYMTGRTFCYFCCTLIHRRPSQYIQSTMLFTFRTPFIWSLNRSGTESSRLWSTEMMCRYTSEMCTCYDTSIKSNLFLISDWVWVVFTHIGNSLTRNNP